jgi:hypothetical protein
VTDCPGSCNSGYRKARAIYEDALAKYEAALEKLADGDEVPGPPEQPDTRPWLGDPVWCSRCTAIIRRELAELDDLAAMLSALPPGIRAAAEGTREHVKVATSRAAASPSPSGDDLDELAGWLAGWEDEYRRLRAWPSSPQRGHLATAITSGIAWLSTHLDGILASPFAQEAGEETRRWHAELRSKTHAASYARHVKKPCPGCKRYTLWEKVGEEYISCVYEDCSRRLTHAELDASAA